MIIDGIFSDRYYVMDDEKIFNGWAFGWSLFNQKSTPKISMDIKESKLKNNANYSKPLNLELWKDSIDYDQNNPGILAKADDLDKRCYQSDIEKAFWLNVTRVPICASYLAACAKVHPATILELGTGGDSAHSTGIFLYWLWTRDYTLVKVLGTLVSVDRHPLSHVWPRYRKYPFWHFIQDDSITTMHKLLNKEIGSLPSWFDLIFIDSSHTYPHTLKEIEQASFMTHAILLDDTTMDQIKQSLEEFLKDHREWLRIDLAHGVSLIERHEYL